MLRVLIVDDHLLIRCGLKQILQAEFGQSIIIGEAANGQEAIEQVGNANWDVLIMDINLPGRSGLVVLQDIKALCPRLPVLMLSAHSEEEFAVRVLKAGASGFIPKESSHVQLVKAIKTVLAGGKHITDNTAQMLVNQLNAPNEKAPHETLSDREFQVLCMLGEGKTPTEISKALSLSIKTVSTYRSRILEKMNMRTNAQLIHYVVTNKLLQL